MAATSELVVWRKEQVLLVLLLPVNGRNSLRCIFTCFLLFFSPEKSDFIAPPIMRKGLGYIPLSRSQSMHYNEMFKYNMHSINNMYYIVIVFEVGTITLILLLSFNLSFIVF